MSGKQDVRNPIQDWICDGFEALSFLTILPIPSRPRRESDDRLARAMIFFPLVGFAIGILSLLVYNICRKIFPEPVATLALVFLPILLSGGLHADGFADFCDGFFGGRDREQVLRIMKDSRIGAFGAIGLIFLILTQYQLLNVLADKTIFFPMALAAGRWAQVILSFCLPYAGLEGGLGAATASRVTPRELTGATLFLGIPLFVFGGYPAVMALLFLLPVLAGLGLYFKRRIGGLTGDLLGAASEITQLFILGWGVMILGGVH